MEILPNDDYRLVRIKKLARLLDSKFIIPGTRIRFGLDPVFSLFPGIGDIVTYIISGTLIYTMFRYGASGKLVIRMIINSSLDALIGAIPVVGTIFDIFYKANERNVRLLTEHYEKGKHRGSGIGLILLILLIVFITLALIVVGVVALLILIFQSISAII